MKYLVFLFLTGCAATQTYEEISDEAEITGDNTKLEHFESVAEKAYKFRENMYNCIASDDDIWLCSASPQRGRKEPETIDEIVKYYRRYHFYCRCMRAGDMWRSLGI